MGDSPGNPFISNPFMQGTKKKQPDASAPESHRQPQPSSTDPPTKFRDPMSANSPQTSAAKPAAKSKSNSLPKSAPKVSAKSRPSTKGKRSSRLNPAPNPTLPNNTGGYPGGGYKVQVLAKIPMPVSTNMPSRDYLWFATYPIIPRIGDCIFHDGRYFRVDAVFLFESTNASWCADLEVSYYTRRH
ncbi:MAG: hypothetical protein AAF282_23260 [Cyanobacteria bacterium P01_A01_bin.15]